MATKDTFLSPKTNHQNFNPTNVNRYSNLNLIQNYKSNPVSSVQSYSKLNNDKKIDSTNVDNYKENEKLQSWNKSSNSDSLNQYNETENSWKTNENFEKNSMRSNLSLQTASYENSMESRTDTFGKSKKENLNKKEINFSSNISFKFPKQQENDELKEPEIAQFKASENLLNPYKLITPTTIEDESKIISESENECLSEFHKKTSTILDAISPHFITIHSFERIFQNFYQMPLNACLKDSDAKEKCFKSIPNIKIEKLHRGIFISSNLKPAENGFERILTTFEAMEILKGNNKKQKKTVADLQKKFYGRK